MLGREAPAFCSEGGEGPGKQIAHRAVLSPRGEGRAAHTLGGAIVPTFLDSCALVPSCVHSRLQIIPSLGLSMEPRLDLDVDVGS